MIGTTVAHYRITEKIGEGGMGEVYLADDTKLGRQVALKFLPEALTRDTERKQRFVQEARAAAAFQHPHICAVYDVDEIDGRTFLAMEYIRGQSLREAIASKGLTPQRALELGLQIAEGLAKAHEKGVLHRDLKPDNLLISEDGYAKIIDFGLAKLVEPLTPGAGVDQEAETELKTREGMVMGTVAYMSPEQAVGESLDARSDIFSFGVVLYEMLSGTSPFRRESTTASLRALLNESPPPLELSGTKTPVELQRIFEKSLAKERSERYPSMKELLEDLRALREPSRTLSLSGIVLGAGDATRRKRRWGAVALLVAGLSLVGYWVGKRAPSPPAGVGASGRPSVAVLYFEDHTGDADVGWLVSGVPSMLLTGLAQTPGLDVISNQRIHEILKEVGEVDLGTMDKSLVGDIARQAGAGAVVVGSIFKLGEAIRIDVQLEDIGSGKILSAESVTGTDVFPLVDTLIARIRASLDVGDRPAGRGIAEITTPSLEAYRLYSEGLEAMRNVRNGDARELFEGAVAIDPSFAMAYFQLSKVIPSVERVERERHLTKALELQDKLPERQRLQLLGRSARMRGDFQEVLELAEALVSRYPDEEAAYFALAEAYRLLNRPDERLRAMERGVEALPSAGHLHNSLGYVLLEFGRYPEAIRELEIYASLSPREPNPQDSLGDAHLLNGQPEKALERFTRALEIDPSWAGTYNGRAWAYGMLGRYDEALAEIDAEGEFPSRRWLYHLCRALLLSRVGRDEEARDHVRTTMEEVDDAHFRSFAETRLASLAFERRSYAQVVEAVGRAERHLLQVSLEPQKTDDVVVLHLLAGAAEARLGNLEAARARLEAQSEFDLEPADRKWWHAALAGEIALAEGDLAAAESVFARGEPAIKMPHFRWHIANALPFRAWRARVKRQQGDLAGAIELYRALNRPDAANKWTAMLEPRYVLELARLLDEAGQKEAAREEYERFLELWKDADPGHPELAEAQAYVAR